MIKVEPIETQRLMLRRYKMTDLADFVGYRANEKLHEFLPSKVRENSSGYKKSLADFVKNYNNEKRPTMTWAIALKDSNKVIGSVSVESYEEQNKCVEIGWALSVKYQHKGYAFEACKALIDYLFEKYDLNRIQAFVWEGNEASRKLAKKLGFTHEGTNRAYKLKGDKYFDVLNFGLLKSEWQENK